MLLSNTFKRPQLVKTIYFFAVTINFSSSYATPRNVSTGFRQSYIFKCFFQPDLTTNRACKCKCMRLKDNRSWLPSAFPVLNRFFAKEIIILRFFTSSTHKYRLKRSKINNTSHELRYTIEVYITNNYTGRKVGPQCVLIKVTGFYWPWTNYLCCFKQFYLTNGNRFFVVDWKAAHWTRFIYYW